MHPTIYNLVILSRNHRQEYFLFYSVESFQPNQFSFYFSAGNLPHHFAEWKTHGRLSVLLFLSYKKFHSTFGVSSLPRRLEAAKERKRQAISSKQHLYGTQGGRHQARGFTWRNWHSSPAKRIHFNSFADSSTADPTCNL
jgi:hypothetical protein